MLCADGAVPQQWLTVLVYCMCVPRGARRTAVTTAYLIVCALAKADLDRVAMATAPVYVGAIDQGTTSSRFVLFDGRGKIVASANKEHKQIYPNQGTNRRTGCACLPASPTTHTHRPLAHSTQAGSSMTRWRYGTRCKSALPEHWLTRACAQSS